MVTDFLLGADPELFIINETTGKVVSAIGIIPGEKGNPWVGKDMPAGYGLEIDNILGEFNIPPASNREEFVHSIEFMKDYIDKFVKNINPELGILCAASMEVDEDQLQHPEAKRFGCCVDYNVYTEKPNPKPKGELTNLRSGGFHLHCGYPNPTIETSLLLIKYFDMYVGVPSVIMDTDTRRRSLYGKAGCFRLCEYGFEYRTLSSAMMADNGRLHIIYSQVKKAINAYNRDALLCDSDLIQEAINDSNFDLAKKIIDRYNILS